MLKFHWDTNINGINNTPMKVSVLCYRAELEWSNDTEGYASSSLATGSVSLAGQVKGDDPD